MLINTFIKKLKHRDPGSLIKHHNSNSLAIMILTIIAVCFAMFIWEHIALNNNLFLRPTYFIDLVTSVCRKVWRLTGIVFAYLGTYYHYLHLESLGTTMMSFWLAFFNLITSFTYFDTGFKSVANLYGNPNAVGFTAWISTVLGIYLCWRFGVIDWVSNLVASICSSLYDITSSF